jgi:ATP-dependent Lon protease
LFLVGTIRNVLVMGIGWTDVGSGGYILVSCAHSNTSLKFTMTGQIPYDHEHDSS